MSESLGSAVLDLTADSKRLKGDVDAAHGWVQSKLGGAAKLIGKTMLAATGALAVGLGFAAKAGIDYNSSIQQTTISLSTMTGSAEKARTVVDQIAKLAAKTPFEFPELADATKRLVAYGIGADDAVGVMARLGDVAAGLNIPLGEIADIYGKIRVQGRVTMEDMNQLMGRGIPIVQELAKNLGVAPEKIRGMVEAGKIGFPEIEKSFQSLTDKGGMFAGMMDAQSQSFAGLMSTFKDNLNAMFGEVMQPVFTWLTTVGLPAIISAMPTIQRVVTGVFDAIGSAVGWFKANVIDTILIPAFTAVKDWVVAHWPEIQDGITKALERAGEVMTWVKDEALPPLRQAFSDIKDFVVDIMAPKLKEAWDTLQQWWADYGPVIRDLVDDIKWAASELVDFWRGNWPDIKQTTESNDPSGSLRSLAEVLGGLLTAARDAVSYIRDNWGTIGPIMKLATDIALGPLRDLFNALDAIRSAAERAIDALARLAGAQNNYDRTHAQQGGPGGGATYGHASPSAGQYSPTYPIRMAAGGLVTRPTLAMVGEAGEAEAVIPLSRLEGLISSRLAASVAQLSIPSLAKDLRAAIKLDRETAPAPRVFNLTVNANDEAGGRAAADGFVRQCAALGIVL